jgi:hypothetical protein
LSIEKWREAHPTLTFPDHALKTMLPFPSLAINDYIHFLESRGVGADVVSFVKDIGREIVWVYDNWKKEQHTRDGVKLLDDLVRNVPKGELYSDQFFRFIRDYRDAHNLNWAKPADQHAWEEAMMQPTEKVTM